MPAKKFEGPLAVPILIETHSVSLLTDTPEGRAEVDKHNKEEIGRAFLESLKKLDDLLRHYEIEAIPNDNSAYVLLSLRMAMEFVPGFKIKNVSTHRQKGRKKIWDPIKYSELLADVTLLKSEKNRSDSEACSILANSPRFASRWGGFDKRTLENRLVKATDRTENPLIVLYESVKAQISEEQFFSILVDSFAITENQR